MPGGTPIGPSPNITPDLQIIYLQPTYLQTIYLQTIDLQATDPQPTQAKIYSKKLANLAKLYTNKSKYSSENNNFNFKLTIFIDLCQKVDIPKQEFSQAYSTMLCGLALNHYYTNLKSNPFSVSFNKLCKAIHNYFEGP